MLPGDAVGGGGAAQALDVVAEAEDGGPVGRLVGAYPFEDGGAVVEGVGEQVDPGILPGHQFTVHPDGGGVLHAVIVARRVGRGIIPSARHGLSVGDGASARASRG